MHNKLYNKSSNKIEKFLKENDLNKYLHEECITFSAYVNEKKNFKLEALFEDVPDKGLLLKHCYNITNINNKKHYIDVRGITDNLNEFFKGYNIDKDKKYIILEYNSFNDYLQDIEGHKLKEGIKFSDTLSESEIKMFNKVIDKEINNKQIKNKEDKSTNLIL